MKTALNERKREVAARGCDFNAEDDFNARFSVEIYAAYPSFSTLPANTPHEAGKLDKGLS